MSDDTEAGTLDAENHAAATAPATPFDDIDKVSDTGKDNSGGDEGSFAGASDLEAVFDVPVKVSAILGRSRMDVADLLKLSQGSVVELDRKVGEAIDIYVNDRLVARGEVVLVEDRLGVTMTEIIQTEN
jgi:flagellar motor switch protein FliN/FliY